MSTDWNNNDTNYSCIGSVYSRDCLENISGTQVHVPMSDLQCIHVNTPSSNLTSYTCMYTVSLILHKIGEYQTTQYTDGEH